MSKILSRSPKHVVVVFYIAVGIFAILGLYGIAIVVIPVSITALYQNSNCGFAIQLDRFYESIYPAGAGNSVVVNQVKECITYDVGRTEESNKDLAAAYKAYKAYLDSYPSGRFTSDAREHAGSVLLSEAKGCLDQKEYSEAITAVKLISSDYFDTSAGQGLEILYSDIYSAWGSDLSSAGDFSGAEKVYKEFDDWARNGQYSDIKNQAVLGLAQTYLDWGKDLAAKNSYKEADDKLYLATQIGKDNPSEANVLQEAQSLRPKVYIAWGDSLSIQSDFENAIQKYQMAVNLSQGTDQPSAKDAFAGGYLKWGDYLSKQEDFLGALDKGKTAESLIGTDSMKQAVSDARAAVYLAFSKSSGSQAAKEMSDAIQSVCDDNIPPGLPIFGLDPQNIKAGFYGATEKFPDSVTASTPGTMHYAACISETIQILQQKTIMMYTSTNWMKPTFPLTIVRDQTIWKVKVLKVKTGEVIIEKSFLGPVPDQFPETSPAAAHAFFLGYGLAQSIHGGKPDILEVTTWLLSIMK